MIPSKFVSIYPWEANCSGGWCNKRLNKIFF